MKRTLYLAFLAVTLGSVAIAQDGRGRNKQDQRSDPPRQEQRRETPPPPQREQKRETPPPPQRQEQKRETPPPPQRQEQKRETPPPPQRQEEKRETPPPPRRDDNRAPDRNTPPPPRRDDQNRDQNRDRNTPPPPRRDDNRPAERPQQRDDNGRGQPRNDQPRQDRPTTQPPQRGDQNRDRTPERNQPGDQRGTNGGSRGPGATPGLHTPNDPGGQRGIGATHNNPAQRNEPRRTFTPPPTVVNNKVTNRAWREDRTVRTVPYRSGYYHYNDSWRDSNFCYTHYVFDFSDRCAPSPWYWYPHLPAYVSLGRCRPTVAVVFNFGYGDPYAYRPYYYSTFEPTRLDVAADRMEDSFRQRDFSRLSYLVDRDDWVQIQVENADTYDLRGDDFADMMRDLIEETHTISYKIVDVHSWRDGASITARHTYVDSWGRREVVEHSYGFRLTREGYRIVSFRTDHF